LKKDKPYENKSSLFIEGELDIVERINSTGQTQLYLTLGKWGTGFLAQLSTNEYRWDVDSDYLQSYYSGGYYGEPDLTVSFDGSSMLTMREFGVTFGVFEKEQVVGNLPVQPWSPDSCGPE